VRNTVSVFNTIIILITTMILYFGHEVFFFRPVPPALFGKVASMCSSTDLLNL